MAIKQGATCVWTKSSYSTGNGACVEVKSPVPHAIAVRDSKVPAGRNRPLTYRLSECLAGLDPAVRH
jgi:uncharacterized protein DUF397